MTDDTAERNRVDTDSRSVSHLNTQDRPSSQRSCHDPARSWWVLGCAAVAVIILCVGLASAVGTGIPGFALSGNGSVQDQATTNKLTICSTSDGNVSYSVVVSGALNAESGADVDDEDAEYPDVISQSTAVGRVAEHGVDNFTFSGRIIRLNLSGEGADVYVNGEQIDPTEYPTTPSATATQTPTPTETPELTETPTPTATAIPTSTPTPTLTETATATSTSTSTPMLTATATTSPSRGYRSTPTATPVPTPTATATATSAVSSPSPRTTTSSKTSSISPSTSGQQRSREGGGRSGLLDWVASNLFLFGGLVVLILILVAVLIVRLNRKPRF